MLRTKRAEITLRVCIPVNVADGKEVHRAWKLTWAANTCGRLSLQGGSCKRPPRSPKKQWRPAVARVTVEDCIEKIPNRFELVLMAAHRARMISSGGQITVDRDNDKNPDVALREIGDGMTSPDDLQEDLIHSLQKYVEVDEPEQEVAPR